jgi:hypothetical protein
MQRGLGDGERVLAETGEGGLDVIVEEAGYLLGCAAHVFGRICHTVEVVLREPEGSVARDPLEQVHLCALLHAPGRRDRMLAEALMKLLAIASPGNGVHQDRFNRHKGKVLRQIPPDHLGVHHETFGDVL